MPGADCYSPPATHGTLAIVAYESYELREPGTSYKPDLGHEKGDLRPQNTLHWAISFCKSKIWAGPTRIPGKAILLWSRKIEAD